MNQYIITVHVLALLQGSLQQQEESDSDSSLSQSPSVQDWLAQARTTRSQQQEDSLQRQRVHFDILFFCIRSIESMHL